MYGMVCIVWYVWYGMYCVVSMVWYVLCGMVWYVWFSGVDLWTAGDSDLVCILRAGDCLHRPHVHSGGGAVHSLPAHLQLSALQQVLRAGGLLPQPQRHVPNIHSLPPHIHRRGQSVKSPPHPHPHKPTPFKLNLNLILIQSLTHYCLHALVI